MTTVNAYRALLRELDKFGSPDFTKSDFNYFFHKGVREALKSLVTESEKDPNANRAVSRFLVIDEQLKGAEGVWDLPLNYGEIKLVWVQSGKAADEAKRLTSTTKGYTLKNSFLKPTASRFYFEEAEPRLRVYGEEVQAVRLDYYRTPAPIDLIGKPDELLDGSPDFIEEAIQRTARIFLENVSDQRYQSQVQETQVRKL